MSTVPYVAGPCAIWVGLPTQLAALVPLNLSTLSTRPTGTFTAVLSTGQSVVPGAASTGIPADIGQGLVGSRGGTITSTPARVKEFAVRYLRTIRPVLLGFCEDSPHVEMQPAYTPVRRTVTGNVHPAYRIYEGTEGTVVADLTRWNEFAYAVLASRGAMGGLAQFAPRGVELDSFIGTVMEAEGAALPLWLVFPYAAKFFGLAGMPPGYLFYAATLDTEGLGPLSKRPRKLRLVWHCGRLEDPISGVVLCHSHDLSALPRGAGV